MPLPTPKNMMIPIRKESLKIQNVEYIVRNGTRIVRVIYSEYDWQEWDLATLELIVKEARESFCGK